MSIFLEGGITSTVNSTTTLLTAGTTFTGAAELNNMDDVLVTIKTDQNGTLYCDFSPDGTNWDSTLSFPYDTANINPPHVLVKGSRYFRIRFTNSSASDQTYLRLYTYYGSFQKLTSTINSIIPQTFDALVTRPIDFNLNVAKGLYQNHSIVLKDGINPDIDSGSTPEDIFGGGGTYNGFPLTAEEGQIVVAGADTGTVYYSYLASSTSTSYQFGTKAVAGAGNYDLGHDIYRCNFAYFVSSSPTSFNSGDITIRQKVTTASVFCIILANQGQTFCAAYTVPQGYSAYVDRITGSIRGGTSSSADGYFWYRDQGGSPRLRFPYTLTFGTLYFDDVDYLIKVPAGTDFIPRVTLASANNLVIQVSYRLLVVKE